MPGFPCVLSVDVEDWFHILDSPGVPAMARWDTLESRVERNVDRLLEICQQTGAKATFFWLGWLAERHRGLVRRCKRLGHEVASHGYAHVLAYQVGCKAFRQDVVRAKGILEEITGERVAGFRAAGFGITDRSAWAFEEIRRAGHQYDSSIFPAARGHGGLPGSRLGCHVIHTRAGPLLEWPMPMVTLLGRRVHLFGGGYLRLAPKWLIRWGIGRLEASNQPLVVYVHPREIDPDHPRLPLRFTRRLKSYVRLGSTMPKLRWLCEHYDFRTMRDAADEIAPPPPVPRRRGPVA